MNAQYQLPRTSHGSLSDLDIVSPELTQRITEAASVRGRTVRESFIHRCSESFAEFAAACEMAENLGLVVN